MFNRKSLFTLAAVTLAALSLGGCDDFKRAVGMEKVVPDEFAVVSRAPLAIPPDYALRPPRAGAGRPQEQSPTDQARQTVFRAGGDQQSSLPPPADQRSPGEGELLKEAGVSGDQTNIRDVINTEADSNGALSDSFVDRLAFWRKKPPGSPDDVIDPTEEAARLQTEKAAAQVSAAAVTPTAPASLDGKPTIERTPSSSWFGSLFGSIF